MKAKTSKPGSVTLQKENQEAEKEAECFVSDDYQNDPANIPAIQVSFYQLAKPAELAGLTALKAAHLILIREDELLDRLGIPCPEIDAPPLAMRLLTLEEMNTSGAEGTFRPLAEWLRRAREKNIAYIPGLDYAVEQAAMRKPFEAREQAEPQNIPGKMPHISIGKLAIKLAWKIECETGKRATASKVIEGLQKMEADEPIITEIIPHGVEWALKKGGEKSYDVEACAKTLENWNKSRP